MNASDTNDQTLSHRSIVMATNRTDVDTIAPSPQEMSRACDTPRLVSRALVSAPIMSASEVAAKSRPYKIGRAHV